MKTQLLCTFTNKQEVDKISETIKNSYDIVFNKIYIFQNEGNINELICTYNVDYSEGLDYNLVPNTISIHRKKHTNTLYTINALNELIKDLNNGLLDTDYNLPWENFRNMLLITNRDWLNKISTRIFKIIKI